MAGFTQSVPAFVDMAMVAHPSVTLLIDLSESEGLRHDTRGRRGRGSFVAGLLPGEVRAAGTVGTCLQIRLGPPEASAVLGASSDLTGGVESFSDVWGSGARQAEDELRAAGSWDERFAIAARLLRRRTADRRPVDPEVLRAWRRMLTARGRVRVGGLADEVGWSRKRLSARFGAQLGIAPKRAARLVRFDHAAHLLATGLGPAAAAHASGYVDQSHLHREVGEFTGLTPTAVAAAPWLAIDDVAWPESSPAGPGRGRSSLPGPGCDPGRAQV
ncbi:hypothetical protein SUDANB140_07398 [Streptomyces sp. enrichment culture]